nr:unnamed protein product [Callosobruchus analis]
MNKIFVVAGKKYPRIIVDHYEYSVHKKVGLKTRWRCALESKTRCKAVCYTYGNNVVLRKIHSHQPSAFNESLVGTYRKVNITREGTDSKQ